MVGGATRRGPAGWVFGALPRPVKPDPNRPQGNRLSCRTQSLYPQMSQMTQI
jgi:hypothetical protein